MKTLRWLSLAAALAVSGCGRSNNRAPAGAGGIGGAGTGGGSGAPGACMDRPTDLLRPPNGGLPCELIPPGLHL